MSDLIRDPIAGDVPLSGIIDPLIREGDLYEQLPGGAVHCFACGHNCKIKPGARGICQVRYNLDGKLFVPWGYVSGLNCDPIEKKPFFHVYPGSDVLTFGMLGCDLHCPYCQNWASPRPCATPMPRVPRRTSRRNRSWTWPSVTTHAASPVRTTSR